jgi:hypothetical protein
LLLALAGVHAAAQAPAVVPTRNIADPKQKTCPDSVYLPGLKPSAAELLECAQALNNELNRFDAVRTSESDAAKARMQFFGFTDADGTLSDVLTKPAPKPSVTGTRFREFDFGNARDINVYLIRAHSLYKRMKSAAGKPATAAGTPAANLQLELSSLGTFIHRLLAKQGLGEPFGAILDTGATFAAAGNNEVPNARDSTDTEVRGVIRWESKHFREDYARRWDWSFGGQIGFTPALTLVQVRKVAAAAGETAASANRLQTLADAPVPADPTLDTPNPQVLFRPAFIWDFAPRFNLQLRDNFELSAFVRAGQTRLWSATESFKRGSDSYVAEAIPNRTGSAESFFESGLELRLYDVDLDVAHHEKSYVNPAFSLSAGYRLDDRFQRSGELLQKYDRPRDRWFYRLTINLNKVLQPRKQGEQSETFAFRFSVDHDHGVYESRIPQGTKYTFSTGIDIVKLFTGQAAGGNGTSNQTK